LILKPSSLGDVIQAIPVLRLLKRHLPHSEIYWWIEEGLAPLLEQDPDLAGILRFQRQGWAKPKNWLRLWQDARWARAQQFEWVIDLQCLARSAVFGWMANGGALIGLDEIREGARGFYDEIVPRRSFHTHAVDWYLAVLSHLNVPIHWDFEWLPPKPQLAQAVRSKWCGDGERWVVIQPGARWLNKRWPVESFAEIVKSFPAEHHQIRFAILGGLEDTALGAQITQAAPNRCLDLTGKLSIPEMVEFIRLSELMITNDTGPMHVAAALRKPLIALFGPTEPRRTGPYAQLSAVLQSHVACVPCLSQRCHNPIHMECLKVLSPSMVRQRMVAHLRSSASIGSELPHALVQSPLPS
jgi:lipopolysaccharide heptosyltransferase II